MPNLSAAYNFSNPLQALTREAIISKVIVDHVMKSIKLLQFMMQKGLVDDKRGGAALMWNNNFGSSPNTVTFDGDDPLPINSMSNNLYRAGVGWKSYADAVVLAINDILDNEGSPEAITSLVEAQMDITKMSIVRKTAIDLINNTQAIDPKGIDGFAGAIDDGTILPTYANISRNVVGNYWKAQCNYQVPSTANILNVIHGIDIQASIDGQRPDAYFCGPLLFGQLIESLTPQDAYIQPEMARTAGGNDLIFNGNPVFIDNYMPTGVPTPAPNFTIGGTNSFGQFLGLNSSYLKLVINPKAKFATTDWIAAQNNATVFARIFARLNLVVPKPSAHFNISVQGG
jgi:hypothetical protein